MFVLFFFLIWKRRGMGRRGGGGGGKRFFASQCGVGCFDYSSHSTIISIEWLGLSVNVERSMTVKSNVINIFRTPNTMLTKGAFGWAYE